MWRRLRFVVLGLVVLLAGGVVTLGVAEQPKLVRSRQAVDARWRALRPALSERYTRLLETVDQLSAAGEADRGVTRDLSAALTAWSASVRRADPRAEAGAANRLEAQAGRLRADIASSARLARIGALTSALAAFDDTRPPNDLVDAYNQAVFRYQERRVDTLAVPVARVLGFDERPTLTVSA